MTLAERLPGEDGEIARALIAAIAAYTERVPSARARDAAGCIPWALLAELAEIGLFGLTLPASHGGAGLSFAAAAGVIEALARWDRSVATTVGLHLGLGTAGLVLAGDASQRDRLLPDLAAGRRIAAFGATEPDAGSDLSAVRTRLSPQGSRFVLNGEKAYVTNAGFAGLFTVVAAVPGRDGGAHGRALVLVPRESPGVCVGAEEHKLGLRASSTATVSFADVAVGASQRLDPDGDGHALLGRVLGVGRTLMAAGCCGTADAALGAARAHAANRRQFGRALQALPVVASQLQGMEARLYGMRAVVAAAARAPGDEGATLTAKVFASEAAAEIVDRALQLHGGFGFVEESGLPLLLRDLRVTRIFEGANDVLLVRLGALSRANRAPSPGEGPVATARVRGLAACPGARVLADPLRLHALGALELAARVSAAAWAAATSDADRALAAALDAHLLRSAAPIADDLEQQRVFA